MCLYVQYTEEQEWEIKKMDKIQGIERKTPEGYVALVMESLLPWGDQNIEEERK